MGGLTWKGTLGVILFLLLSAGNASAFDRTYCDPDTDPDSRDCPLGPCESEQISGLPTTDGPANVRSLTGLTTTWDSNDQAWHVNADVSAMKTGVIRVTPNAGIYSSTGTFYENMSTLLGVTMPNQLSIDGRLFPPIILEQRGVSHRLNDSTERWDLLQTRNIIFDMTLGYNYVFEAVQMSTMDRGICTNSETTYQSASYEIDTRDGSYIGSQSECDF